MAATIVAENSSVRVISAVARGTEFRCELPVSTVVLEVTAIAESMIDADGDRPRNVDIGVLKRELRQLQRTLESDAKDAADAARVTLAERLFSQTPFG